MTTLAPVDFEATPAERDRLEVWCAKEHGAQLTQTDSNPYATTPIHENPTEKKRYKAQLSTDFRLAAPKWVIDLIVKG